MSRRHHSARGLLVAGLVVAMVGIGPAWATVRYVTTIGDDGNDGLTWATAMQTVQAGLDAAVSGDEVWVAAGTYVERITLKDGVALYGGFAGSETDRTQRDWSANLTILDGNQGGRVVTAPVGATGTTRIDGFTIRNGNGGIYCSSSSPQIANNRISGNSVIRGGGGGIRCSSSSPTISNNTITGNGASSGAGIYCEGGSPMITNNTITANHASIGGGIDCYNSSPTVVNTIVAFNSSGLESHGSGTPALRHNCVFGNTAYDYSGLTDPTGTDGNISADPKLADLAYGDLHIQPGSPCKDAGDDAVVQAGWLDIDGEARIQNSHVDIGSDESDGTTWPAGPNVIVRVSPEGDDADDGSSWSLSKRTVQAGISAASELGGEVWVRAGTYLERITLMPYAHVYGGFAGTENTRDERNWTTHATILDGQQGGSVVTAQVGFQISTIDGLTIRNGTSGIYCGHSSPAIVNNTITGNGGGISCSSSSPTITANTITENGASSDGGGISCYGISSPTIARNTISHNSASSRGGGIYCGASSPTITNNAITGNSTDSEGGGIYCDRSSATISNNTINKNSASSGGAGIYCDSSSLTITANTIAGNNASTEGGGVYCYSSSPTIANNLITANRARSGGGIFCFASPATIANNTIAGNSADSGGAGFTVTHPPSRPSPTPLSRSTLRGFTWMEAR